MQNTLLRIDKIAFTNYRCFSQLSLELHPELTVIVARNGFGKTAVLDGIAVALGPFIGAFDAARGAHFAASDARRTPSPFAIMAEMEPQFPLQVWARGVIDSKGGSWTRELRGIKAHTTYADAWALIQYGKRLQQQVRDATDGKASPPILPLVSYYGTGRLWSEMRLTTGKKANDQKSRTAGYTDCLVSASRYKAFADWFERLCRAEYEERDSSERLGAIKNILTALRGAVDTVLQPSGWHSITFKSAEGGIVATHDQHETLPVALLSDGMRNLLGLAADIAYRAVRLNSHLGQDAVLQTPGIVLIDEVDMHLHPEWQQVVIESLRKAFPSIQFIVTTHSPQVLTTISKESVRVLRKLDYGWQFEPPELQTRGVESADVLGKIMGVDPMPQVDEAKWLADYHALIEVGQAETEKASGLRSKLMAHFGERHPLILDCDRLIRFQAFKQSRSKARKD